MLRKLGAAAGFSEARAEVGWHRSVVRVPIPSYTPTWRGPLVVTRERPWPATSIRRRREGPSCQRQ